MKCTVHNEIYSSYNSKGLTDIELGLAGLGYSDTIIVRTEFLARAERERSRPVEKIFLYLYAAAASFCLRLGLIVRVRRGLTSVAPNFTSYAEILAKYIVDSGHLGSAALPHSTRFVCDHCE